MIREKHAMPTNRDLFTEDLQLNLLEILLLSVIFPTHTFIFSMHLIVLITVWGSFFVCPIIIFKCPSVIWILMLIDQVVLISQTLFFQGPTVVRKRKDST